MLPSDDRVEGLSTDELYWLAAMMNKDTEEEFLRNRDQVEYLASFINPEAVSKIIDARDKSVNVSDEDFAAILSNLSGRELPVYRKQ